MYFFSQVYRSLLLSSGDVPSTSMKMKGKTGKNLVHSFLFTVIRLSECFILIFFFYVSLLKLLGNQDTPVDLVDTWSASSSDFISKDFFFLFNLNLTLIQEKYFKKYSDILV